MKQVAIVPIDIPYHIRLFVRLWKQKKHYDLSNNLTIGQLLELIIATSTNLHKEDSDGRFFNHILKNDESLVAWDGDELADTLLYQALENIKKRCSTTNIFAS